MCVAVVARRWYALFLHRRPLACRVDQRQYPHGLLAVIDLVHKPVGLLRNQFAGARNPAGMPKHRKLCKSRGGLAEKLVYLDSGRWVVGDDIVPEDRKSTRMNSSP